MSDNNNQTAQPTTPATTPQPQPPREPDNRIVKGE